MPYLEPTKLYNIGYTNLYYYILQEEGIDFSVIHDLMGYDEISLTGPVKLFNTLGEFTLHPSDFGFEPNKAEELYGGDDVASAAKIFMTVIEGNGSNAQKNVVAANAGLGIATYKKIPLKQGVQEAMEALKSKKALDVLNKIVAAG